MRLNKISLALVLAGSALLAACGGGGDSTPVRSGTAAADLTASVTASTAPALLDKSFSFQNGVADLGTTSATTLALSGSAAAPDFSLTDGTNKASGVMTYGSCIFTIKQSNFPANFTKLQVGVVTEVKPCDVVVATAGMPTASSSLSTIKLLLGSSFSLPLGVTVTISDSGLVTISGTLFGTIKLQLATGATGAAS